MTEHETAEEFKERMEARRDFLRDHGFDGQTVGLGGGMFGFLGGISEAAVCLTCYALVPVVDLANFTTAVEAHEAWHREGA